MFNLHICIQGCVYWAVYWRRFGLWDLGESWMYLSYRPTYLLSKPTGVDHSSSYDYIIVYRLLHVYITHFSAIRHINICLSASPCSHLNSLFENSWILHFSTYFLYLNAWMSLESSWHQRLKKWGDKVRARIQDFTQGGDARISRWKWNTIFFAPSLSFFGPLPWRRP